MKDFARQPPQPSRVSLCEISAQSTDHYVRSGTFANNKVVTQQEAPHADHRRLGKTIEDTGCFR